MDENPTSSVKQQKDSETEDIHLSKNQKIVGPLALIGATLLGVWVIYNSPLPQRKDVSNVVENYLVSYREGVDVNSLVSQEYIELSKIKDHSKLGGAQLDGLTEIQVNSLKATVDDVYYRAEGVATYSDGSNAPFVAYMKKEGGSWKISDIEIIVSNERIDKYRSINSAS